MNIVVVGAGAWGTALALSACQNRQSGNHLTLWARDRQQAASMHAGRVNRRYLPHHALPDALAVRSDAWSADGGGGESLATFAITQDLLVIATPMSGLRAVL